MKRINMGVTSIKRNVTKQGQSIEEMFERMKNNNESDISTKEMIYTRPEDGVVYGTDIRGDKFEKALEKTEKVSNHLRQKRKEKYEQRKEEITKLNDKTKGTEDTGKEGESIQANGQ